MFSDRLGLTGATHVDELDTMTRVEAAEAIRNLKKVILPVGATEQHGPHLPLGTDTFLAKYMAQRLALRIGAVVLPPLPVSYSWVWRNLPGTIVISAETLKNLIKDICRSVATWGADQLVIINAHGANDSMIKYAVREISDELPLRVLYFTYPGVDAATDGVVESERWHGMIHSCEVETSWMLAARPDLCHMERAVREYPDTPRSALYHHSSATLDVLSETGVFGDATLATAEKGEVMLERMVGYMERIIIGSEGQPASNYTDQEERLK